MLLTKSEHVITQAVALSSPVSTVYARNALDHEPPFGDQEGLTFHDSGFPKEARVKMGANQKKAVFISLKKGQESWLVALTLSKSGILCEITLFLVWRKKWNV